jgi:hypothetical protein
MAKLVLYHLYFEFTGIGFYCEASTPLSLTRLKGVLTVLNNSPCGVRLSGVEAS